MKKIKTITNFGVASSIWCKMSDIKIDAPHDALSGDLSGYEDKNNADYVKAYAEAVTKKFQQLQPKKLGTKKIPRTIKLVTKKKYLRPTKLVTKKILRPTSGLIPQDAVFCPVYQQQASHNFNIYTNEGEFSEEFITYFDRCDSLLFYGAEGMGCTTIFKKLCRYVLNKESGGKHYLPVYIYANWLFRKMRENKNNYRIDKYIDLVLNDWLGAPNNYKVSELCKTSPLLIIIDDINDDTNEAIFKWICDNINRKDIKIFISTNNSRIRTKFEKTFATLEGKVQYASIYLPFTNTSKQNYKAKYLHLTNKNYKPITNKNYKAIYLPLTNTSKQNYKAMEPSLNELLENTPCLRHMLDCLKKRREDISSVTSVTSLIDKYIRDDSISNDGKLCAIEIFEGRQKELDPQKLKSLLDRNLMHKEGNIYEFKNKILYYYFLARQWFDAFIADRKKGSELPIELAMRSIKSKAADTSGAELLHKYFISLSLDGSQIGNDEKNKILNFYKEEMPLILADSLRWIRDGNKLYWEIGLKGLLNVIKNPEKHSEVDIIDAERMLYQLGIVGTEKNSDRPFLHSEEIDDTHKLKFLLPKEDFWFKISIDDKEIEVARFPVTVAEFSFFLDSGYFCEREKCNAKDAKEVWDKIWGKGEYDIASVAQLMQTKWESIHKKLDNNDIIIRLCNLFSDDKQIKQLYLFKELFDKNPEGKSIKEGVSEIYSVDKLKHPMKWGDPQYSNPYYPIIGINYYEARAYCRWLSLMSQKKGEYEYRLLTRDEWQEMVKGVVPRKEDIICNKDSQDEYLRIAFLSSLRNLDDNLKFKDNINSTEAYGNIFEIVDTRFEKIQYGDEKMAHFYCFGGSYLQKYELAYDIEAKGPYEGQASAFQRNIDIGFRICRIKRKG